MEINSLLRPRLRLAPLHALITINGFILLMALGFTYQNYVSCAALAVELAALKAATRVVTTATRPAVAPEIRKQWNALQVEADFPWYSVFRALEGATGAEIELLEFSPDKVSRRVVFRGEARDQNALINYTAALSEQSIFQELYLAHQKAVHRQGMEVLVFEIRAIVGGSRGNGALPR